jgi:hypothetical protein
MTLSKTAECFYSESFILSVSCAKRHKEKEDEREKSSSREKSFSSCTFCLKYSFLQLFLTLTSQFYSRTGFILTYAPVQKASAFLLSSIYHLSIIFVKNITLELKMLAGDKHTSLFRQSINDKISSIYSL